jgi:uncharacterized protein
MPLTDAEAVTAGVSAADWPALATDLEQCGYAILPLLTSTACRTLSQLYDKDELFRSRIVMQRHGYGSGEYKYFSYPLPVMIEALRRAFYAQLAPIAARWRRQLREPGEFPPALDLFIDQCHHSGQTRPTPLMLKYGAGDYNRLHQDLYGPLVFPLQLTVLLSDPAGDFDGGEFVLIEQRPRMQSRAEVVPLRQGEAVIFPVHHRPTAGARGFFRQMMRHGVSRIRRGERYTLGIIFHDAA